MSIAPRRGLARVLKAIGVPSFALLATLVVMEGCSESEQADSGGFRLEEFHPPDVSQPRETWKDEASLMMFRTPGPGWTRLEGAALTALGPDVRLAVQESARCVGWVSTRAGAGQGTAARAAEAARAALGWEGVQIVADEDVKYDFWTARRYEVQGQHDGRTMAERASFWVDNGQLYIVVARTSERGYVARRRCLDQITAGFTLTRYPGPKRGY